MGNAEDAKNAIEGLIKTLDREWAPHVFDSMVKASVSELGLAGLDVAKYRESRLGRWRELATLFESGETADKAVRAAIRRELEQLFGTKDQLAET